MTDPDVQHGGASEASGDLDSAEAAYRRADERGDAEGALFLGALLRRRGDLPGAEDAYRRSEGRGDPRASCNLAVLLEECGDLAGAEAAYRRADAAGFAGGAYGLGQLLYARGDAEGSLAANRRADELGDGDASYNLGFLLRQKGDLAAAEAAFARADERGVATGSTAVGRFLEERGDLLGAADAYRRGEQGGDPNGAFNLATLLLKRDATVDALAALVRAAEMGHLGAPEAIRLLQAENAHASGTTAPLPSGRSDKAATTGWQIDTALAEIASVADTIAIQRSHLAEVWRSASEALTAANETKRALDAALALRQTALREFLNRSHDFTYDTATPVSPHCSSGPLTRTSGGALVVAPDMDARFDRELQSARSELNEATRKVMKGGARSRAASHIDTYRSMLATLEAERSRAQELASESAERRSAAAMSARADAQRALDEAVSASRTARDRLPCHLRPWTDQIWRGGWKTRSPGLGSAQLFAGTMRPGFDPQIGDNHDFGTEVGLPLMLPASSNLHVVHSLDDRPIAQSLVRSLLLRGLLATEAGCAHLTFFDPVGLGSSAATLLELAEYDPSLVGGKIWSSPQDLLNRLLELTTHIELVLQKHLRSTYASIDEFNQHAGEVAEPYRYLVVFDVPTGFTEETFRELVRIVHNGPRCGVRTIMTSSTDARSPYGIDLNALAIDVPRLVLGQRLSHQHRMYQYDLLFEPDSDLVAGGTLVRDIIDEIGRKSAAQVDPVVSVASVFRMFGEDAAKGIQQGRPAAAAKTDIDNELTWWGCSTVDGISAPIGRKGAGEVAALCFDSGEHAGALLVGRPGAGKSTLLHAFVTSATTLYSPEELELYLIDFKEGVEFNVYASEGLPHARCVAIESDREFALSVLESLEMELKRRGELLRTTGGQHSGLQGLRTATNEIIPRILLIFDEFHVLFTKNDKLGLAAADLLEQIIRQGRSFGIHVLLGSQSLAGLDALGSHVPELLPVRILLPSTEADARRVLGDGNNAGQYLKSHEGILNASGGVVEANEQFRGAFQDEASRRQHVATLRRLANARGLDRRPIVFEGSAQTPIEWISPRQFAEELATTGRAPLRLRIGRPMTIQGPADIHLFREAGSNVLVVARAAGSLEMVVPGSPPPSVPASVLLLSLASLMHSPARIDVADFTPIDEGVETWMAPMLERRRVTVHRRRGFAHLLSEAAEEVRSRVAQDDSGSAPRVLVLYGIHRARDLDASMGLDANPELLDHLEEVVRDGPEVGVHTWVWADTVNALARRLPASVTREFAWRIAGHQSLDDSHTLLGVDVAAELREQQVVLSNDDRGFLKRCITYTVPHHEWLTELLDVRD